MPGYCNPFLIPQTPMKPAKEIRVGNIIMVDEKPFIVLRSDVNGSSRTGFTYKWKMKNLLTNAPWKTCSVAMTSSTSSCSTRSQ